MNRRSKAILYELLALIHRETPEDVLAALLQLDADPTHIRISGRLAALTMQTREPREPAPKETSPGIPPFKPDITGVSMGEMFARGIRGEDLDPDPPQDFRSQLVAIVEAQGVSGISSQEIADQNPDVVGDRSVRSIGQLLSGTEGVFGRKQGQLICWVSSKFEGQDPPPRPTRRRRPKIDYDKVKALFEQGMTAREVAAEVGCSMSAVAKVKAKLGLTRSKAVES